MNILDIAIAKKLAGGGGGSGTDNYNDLSNLPKINDTTLSGNKSSSALGLQSEINSDSKLASDLVDDTNQDNKFVTSTEKNTWNAKQNAIDSDHKLSSDLVDDANHTNKFVTSTEKQTWNAKQNAIDADHKLSSSLVSFTDAEAAALASGIDSSKVGQISTNQTNILYSLQTGVKNICNPDTWILGYYLKPEDGSLIPYPGDNGITSDFIPVDYSSEDYYYISGLQNDGNNLYNVIHAFNASKQFLGRTDGTLDTTRNVYESSFTGGTPVGTGDIAYIRITQYGTSGNVKNIDTSLVMVCTGHAKEQSVAHQQYAKSNAQLTRDCTVNNSRIYAQATEPTDTDIPEGSTWANGASVKGYTKRTDNLFDFNSWSKSITSVNGDGNFSIRDNTILITSVNDADAYTTPCFANDTGVFKIPVSNNTEYTISCVGTNNKCVVFENGATGTGLSHPFTTSTTFTTNSTTTFLTFRVGVDNSLPVGTTATVSSIMLNAGSSALPYAPYLKWQADPALIEQVDAGAKNKLKLDKDAIKSLNSGGSWSGYVYTPTTAPNLTVTINDDSTVTLNGSTSSSLVTVALERKVSSGFQGYVLSGSKTNTKLVYQLAVSPYTVYATADGVGSSVIANYTDGSTIQLSLQIVANSTFSNTVITPMICTEADWNVSQKHVPPALPNYDLTVLQAEDRAALAEVVDSGAKNLLNGTWIKNEVDPITFTTNSDGSVSITKSATSASACFVTMANQSLTAGKQYAISDSLSDHTNVSAVLRDSSGSTTYGNTNGTPIFAVPTTASTYKFMIRLDATYTGTITVYPMLCTKAAYDVSQNFAPYALPNTDLTYLQAEDRAALAEVVDSGAKNIVDISKAYASDYGNVSIDTNTNSVTASGTHAWAKGNIVVSVKPNTTYAIKYRISANTSTVQSSLTVTKGDTSDTYYSHIIASGTTGTFTGEFTTDANASIAVVKITANSTNSEIATAASITISELMICTLADWKVSQKYVPYRKNLDQLEATKAPALDTGAGVDSGSLDDISENTFAIYTTNVSNLPTATSYYYVETSVFNSSSALQRAYDTGNGESYVRVKYQGTWQAWKQITNA